MVGFLDKNFDAVPGSVAAGPGAVVDAGAAPGVVPVRMASMSARLIRDRSMELAPGSPARRKASNSSGEKTSNIRF